MRRDGLAIFDLLSVTIRGRQPKTERTSKRDLLSCM